MDESKKEGKYLERMIKKTKEKRELTPVDMNIEKWNIFSAKKYVAYRKQVRIDKYGNEQSLEIMAWVNEGKEHRTIIHGSGKVYYLFKNLYKRYARLTGGKIPFTIRGVARALNMPWNNKTIAEIENWCEDLRYTPIKFNGCYKTKKDGEFVTMREYKTILSDLGLFQRSKRKEGEPYTEQSYFSFDELIEQSLESNYTKPILVSTILKIKGGIAFAVYRWLDLLLFQSKEIERDATWLQEELGLDYMRRDNFLCAMKNAVKELAGIELSCGIIKKIAFYKEEGADDYKFVAERGPLPKEPDLTEELSATERGIPSGSERILKLKSMGTTGVSEKFIANNIKEIKEETDEAFNIVCKKCIEQGRDPAAYFVKMWPIRHSIVAKERERTRSSVTEKEMGVIGAFAENIDKPFPPWWENSASDKAKTMVRVATQMDNMRLPNKDRIYYIERLDEMPLEGIEKALSVARAQRKEDFAKFMESAQRDEGQIGLFDED